MLGCKGDAGAIAVEHIGALVQISELLEQAFPQGIAKAHAGMDNLPWSSHLREVLNIGLLTFVKRTGRKHWNDLLLVFQQGMLVATFSSTYTGFKLENASREALQSCKSRSWNEDSQCTTLTQIAGSLGKDDWIVALNAAHSLDKAQHAFCDAMFEIINLKPAAEISRASGVHCPEGLFKTMDALRQCMDEFSNSVRDAKSQAAALVSGSSIPEGLQWFQKFAGEDKETSGVAAMAELTKLTLDYFSDILKTAREITMGMHPKEEEWRPWAIDQPDQAKIKEFTDDPAVIALGKWTASFHAAVLRVESWTGASVNPTVREWRQKALKENSGRVWKAKGAISDGRLALCVSYALTKVYRARPHTDKEERKKTIRKVKDRISDCQCMEAGCLCSKLWLHAAWF